MIQINKPFLPPVEEYEAYLKDIWKHSWLTNNGPYVQQLEAKLAKYLEVDNLLFVTNGTIALQLAIKALELQGEVITSPFSFVATTSSLVWQDCTPVFADIDPLTLNIDPDKIELKITKNTTAILATHVYGNPCEIVRIENIAKQHNLKVIYDAAHCFGSLYKEKSVMNFGDISTISFHSTKLFHTIEGGAVITPDIELSDKLASMRNFGHDGPEKFVELGINGKNSEFHAAMGLVNLKYADEVLAKRKADVLYYKSKLKIKGLKFIHIRPDSQYNYAYCPVIFKTQNETLAIKNSLEKENIYPRRYFYPTLNQLNYVNESTCSIAEDIAKRILCLPLYFDITNKDINNIVEIIITTLKKIGK